MLQPRTPLIAHWTHPQSYKDWSTRAERVVQFIRPDEKWICDIGCGALQPVRHLLSANAIYLPADVREWTPDTVLCDLEGGILPLRYLVASDVCMMLGVVEYLSDPAAVFRLLAPSINRLLVTYAATDAKPDRNALWTSHLSKSEFEKTVEDAGFRITARHFIEDHLQIFLELTSRRKSTTRPISRALARYAIGRQRG